MAQFAIPLIIAGGALKIGSDIVQGIAASNKNQQDIADLQTQNQDLKNQEWYLKSISAGEQQIADQNTKETQLETLQQVGDINRQGAAAGGSLAAGFAAGGVATSGSPLSAAADLANKYDTAAHEAYRSGMLKAKQIQENAFIEQQRIQSQLSGINSEITQNTAHIKYKQDNAWMIPIGTLLGGLSDAVGTATALGK